MERITKDLYIGGVTTREAVKHNGIKCVIFLSDMPTEYPGYNYHIFDSGNNDPKKFISILKFVDEHMRTNDTPILLNCSAGMSRSPIIAALWLYHSGEYASFDNALEFVLSKSSVAKPNPRLINFVKAKVLPLMV